MARTLIQELIIPKEQGRALTVQKGQVLRIIEIEGPQMADVAIFNAQDYKEVYDPALSYALNALEGIGDLKRITKLYSRPPRANIMFTVIDDKVGVHCVASGTKCNAKFGEIRRMIGQKEHSPYTRSCQDNLAEAIEPYGLTPDEVPDVFNAFMNVDIDGFIIRPPMAKKGDYIDLLAEMDCLVAISACPRQLICNDTNKPLKIEIWE